MQQTISVIISAQPSYIPAQSDPLNQKFVWSYEIKIVNESEDIVQLLNRFWRITDMTGKIEEIHGAGVVGLQPLIKPGKQFIYTSYCQLVSPQGTMEGHYEVQNKSCTSPFGELYLARRTAQRLVFPFCPMPRRFVPMLIKRRRRA